MNSIYLTFDDGLTIRYFFNHKLIFISGYIWSRTNFFQQFIQIDNSDNLLEKHIANIIIIKNGKFVKSHSRSNLEDSSI